MHGTASWTSFTSRFSGRDDVLRGRALGPFNDVELNRSTFCEGLESLSLNGTVVNKAVLASVRRCDESESFLIVEPLHGSCSTHSYSYGVSAAKESRIAYFRLLLLLRGLSTPDAVTVTAEKESVSLRQ